MIRPIYQVSLTYLQRWPLWLAAVAYMVALGIALPTAGHVSNDFRVVSPDFPQPGPTVNLLPPKSFEQISRETRSLFWNAERLVPTPIAISKPFPELVSLQIVGSLKSDDDLQILRSMPNLEALSFFSDFSPESMKYVGELTRLRHLRLLEAKPERGLRHLRGLSQLQILEILAINRVQDAARLFDEIRQIPSLRRLVVPGQMAFTFQASDWERLRSLPNLTHLYLLGNMTGPENVRLDFDRVQQILPHVKVRPYAVTELRTNVWCYIAFAGTLIWGLLVVQLQSQFSHSASRLIPNYTTYHLGAAVSLWVVTTALHTVILWRADCSFVASLAGSLFVPGLFWGLNAALLRSSHKPNQAGTLQPLFAAAMCLQVGVITWGVSRYFLGDLDWFLSGRQPVLTWGLAVAGLVAPVLVFLSIPRLHSFYLECTAGLPPLGISPKAWIAWGKNLAESQEGTWRSRFAGTQIARLDAVLASPRPYSLSRLWIAGNAMTGLRMQVRLLLVIVTAVIVYQVAGLRESASQSHQPSFMVLMAWTWFDMVSLALVGIWRSRRPVLGFELLRPSNREGFVRQIFVAVLRDLSPLLVCHAVAVAILLTVSGVSIPHLFIPAVVCYCVFHALSIYATILFLLAIRPGWLVIVLMSIIWPLIATSGIYLALAIFRTETWFPVVAISLYLAASVVVLFCLSWLKRYWQRIELAGQ